MLFFLERSYNSDMIIWCEEYGMKFSLKDLKTLLMVCCSSFLYAIAMKAFVETGSLFPGGFAGLSRLIVSVGDSFLNVTIPFGVIYFTLNLIPTFLVFKTVGKRFTLFSVIQFSLTSFLVSILPTFPVTDDLLLISIFGGIIAGTAISIALVANASSGGTDFIAIYLSKRLNKPSWSYIMFYNVTLLAIVGLLFSWELSMYSIIYQFCSNQIVQTLHTRFKLSTLVIITDKPDEVSIAMFKACRHGITKLDAEGMYSHSNKSMLYMIANEFQVDTLVRSIKETDPCAFITITKTEKIVGNYYQLPYE